MSMVKVCFGGTFDPVHAGHIGSAKALAELLAVPVTLLPNGVPAHRDRPDASPEQRLAMLRMACENEAQLLVDSREIERTGPSYTIDSVMAMRAEMASSDGLIWCLGEDAFAQLHTWHRWRDLLQYTHLLVLQRPASDGPKDTELLDFWQRHRVRQVRHLLARPSGSIASIGLPQYAVSATTIRQLLVQGKTPPEHMLPAKIAHYIAAQNLYKVEAN
ncbi:MAG: nicotinate-nucleotide adenylyltransferase [Gammaproteobacteria bacterium]|jgi:nicotinate-nucleotide adenylyltransferase|nr:nicotinate-nucleotide adenylyltransferase [Gammaproteobacteria bacterium]